MKPTCLSIPILAENRAHRRGRISEHGLSHGGGKIDLVKGQTPEPSWSLAFPGKPSLLTPVTGYKKINTPV